MKGKISILILSLLSLFLYVAPAAGEVYMGEVGVNNIIEVKDEAHMFPVFFAFKQPPAIRPFSLYFIKQDVSGLWYYKDGWQIVNSGNPDNLLPAIQTSDASEIDAIKYLNAPLPLSFFTGGGTSWKDVKVYVCLDEENAATGIADMGTANPNCGSLGFINKIGNGGGVPVSSYAVTPSAGANGTISPATPQSVNQGSTTTFTVTPNNGYTASVGGTCGGTLSGNTYTTGPINVDCTVSAVFAASATTHIVTPSAGANGSITPSTPQPINEGFKTTFQVSPNTGYAASVGGTCGGTLSGTTYTTIAITADCTVSVTFNSTQGGNPDAPPIDLGLGNCTAPSSISMTDIVSITADPNVTKQSAPVAVNNNCRKGVSYTAQVTTNSPWLSVPKSGSGTIVVTVDTHTGKGASSAGKYTARLKISSPGLTEAIVEVDLYVTGPVAACNPSKAVITPLSIDKTGAGTVYVSIKDDCKNDLAFTVDAPTYTDGAGWIVVPTSGKGQLSIALNSSGLTAGAKYKGALTVTPQGYIAVIIPVNFTVSTAQPTTSGNVTSFVGSYNARFWVEPNRPYYYSFNIVNSTAKPNNTTIAHGAKIEDMTQTQVTSGITGTHNVDVLVRYAGATCDTTKLPDFNLLTDVKAYCASVGCQPVWHTWGWGPKRYGEAQGMDLFYSLSSGSTEGVSIIGNPLSEGCYYIMLYNTGTGKGYIAFSAG